MIIAHNGSVANIPSIPDDIKAIYKTVWEISQKKVIDMAADRGAFVCQSQSLNIHLQAPTMGQLTSMHFYGWKKGLKTGMYYLRTRPAAQAIQFTVDQSILKTAKSQESSNKRLPTTSVPAVAPPSPVRLSAMRVSQQSPVAGPSASENAAAADSSSGGPSASTSLENGEIDPEYAAALQRQKDRELAEAKLLCSLENKEACLMCSG